MALERTNPPRPGVFWIDIWRPSMTKPEWPDGGPVLHGWLEENPASVRVERREVFTPNNAPIRVWYLLVISGPTTPFPQEKLGFLTIQTLGEAKPADLALESDDTVQKPPPEPLFDPKTFFGVTGGVLGGVALIGGLVVAGVLAANLRRR